MPARGGNTQYENHDYFPGLDFQLGFQSVKFTRMFPNPNNDKNQNMKYMEPKTSDNVS